MENIPFNNNQIMQDNMHNVVKLFDCYGTLYLWKIHIYTNFNNHFYGVPQIDYFNCIDKFG